MAKNIQLKDKQGNLLYPRTKVSLLVDEEGQLADLATNSYVNAQDEATLTSAKSYADGKASTAEQNAKTYADGLNTAMDTRMDAAEGDIDALELKVGNDTVANQISSAIEDLDLENTYYAKSSGEANAAAITNLQNDKQDKLAFEGTYDASTNKVTTKSYVDSAIAAVHQFEYEVVATLPSTQEEMAAKLGKILLYKPAGASSYEEYIVIDGGKSASPRYSLEKIGDTDIQLVNYYTKSEMDTALAGKQATIDASNKLGADLVDDSSSTHKFVSAQDLSDIAANTSARHTHSNKAILDATTASFTSELATDIADNKTARHTHSNKSILDDITAAYTSEEATKLSGIETGAQVNVIESITLNGSAVSISNKTAALGNLQAANANLTAISAITGAGLAKRNSDGTWELDESDYALSSTVSALDTRVQTLENAAIAYYEVIPEN